MGTYISEKPAVSISTLKMEVVDCCENLVIAIETKWSQNSEGHNIKCYLLFNMDVKLSLSFQGKNPIVGVHNTVLGIIFKSKEYEVTEEFKRKLHNEKLPSLFFSANIVRV
jgi:hypothetical protein